jgi:tripartite-type tricarboxylate transporter receptor subunit TctC
MPETRASFPRSDGRLWLMAVLAAGLILSSHSLMAQTYPQKTVRIVVPAAPGGGTDILARIIAYKLTENLGQQFVAENRPGAGQILGTESVARSAPDGYTLLMGASPIATNQVLYKKIPYDTLRDFAPIMLCASAPNLLVVHPALPANSVKELVALAKSRPGQITYASAGVGTSPHLSMELFLNMAGIRFVHIPYKGTGPALIDVIAGHVQSTNMNILAGVAHVKAGKLRALAITSANRSAVLPALPTVAEAGVAGYEAISWFGLLAPAGTPRPIIEKIYTETVKVLQMPEVREKLAGDGAEPTPNRPDEFAAYIRSEIIKWTKLVKDRGIATE